MWLRIIVLLQELQKYLDEAPDGVIYFSMGSNLKSTSMPESKRNAFLGAFSKLKQRVLWKWESDTLPGQPSNVKLGKWLPQSDILGEFCYTGKTVGMSCMRDGM
jgi:UDP:flavonoid glycosyltransferase YjiC (YdhE family)